MHPRSKWDIIFRLVPVVENLWPNLITTVQPIDSAICFVLTKAVKVPYSNDWTSSDLIAAFKESYDTSIKRSFYSWPHFYFSKKFAIVRSVWWKFFTCGKLDTYVVFKVLSFLNFYKCSSGNRWVVWVEFCLFNLFWRRTCLSKPSSGPIQFGWRFAGKSPKFQGYRWHTDFFFSSFLLKEKDLLYGGKLLSFGSKTSIVWVKSLLLKSGEIFSYLEPGTIFWNASEFIWKDIKLALFVNIQWI